LRFWRVTPDKSRVEQYHKWPINGIINSIKISHDHKTIAVAVAQENRTGRWNVDKNAKNGIYIIKLDSENENEGTNGFILDSIIGILSSFDSFPYIEVKFIKSKAHLSSSCLNFKFFF